MRRKSIAMALCATVVCAGLGAAQLSSFASEAETGTEYTGGETRIQI